MKVEEISSNPFFNPLWKFFVSIRLTVGVLLTLAATSAIGTLIPQNESIMAYRRAYGDVLYHIFSTLDIFDMYHSWWFQLLMVLLTLNIIACSIDRLSGLWKIIFVKKPNFRFSAFKNLSTQVNFTLNQPAESLKNNYEQMLSKMFKSVKIEATETGFFIFAEKGRWTRLGVYIVHLSVILLLLGSLIGSIFGFEGFANIAEGDSVQAIHLRSSNQIHTLDFAIRCDNFQVSFYDSGAPKEYRSHLALVQDNKEIYKKEIVVNDPLRYDGINIFQSSYGTVPLGVNVIKRDGVTLAFKSKDSGIIYKKKAKMGEPISIAEGGGTFVIKDFASSYQFMGARDLGQTLIGEITPVDGGEPSEVKLPLRFSRFDQMRRNSKFIISIEGYAQQYYTGLQITKDPGVPVVYAGFLLMIAGCFITFFMAHQKICLQLISNYNKTNTQITLFGTSNKNKTGMLYYLQRLSKKLINI